MRKLKIERFPPITQADIEHFETTYNVKLPDDYKAFLLAYNGGYPHISAFEFKINGRRLTSGVYFFCGLGDVTDYARLSEMIEYVREDCIAPSYIVPIAGATDSDIICLSTREEDYGCIYYYDHNWPFRFEKAPGKHKTAFFLADSFTAFLDMLKNKV